MVTKPFTPKIHSSNIFGLELAIHSNLHADRATVRITERSIHHQRVVNIQHMRHGKAGDKFTAIGRNIGRPGGFFQVLMVLVRLSLPWPQQSLIRIPAVAIDRRLKPGYVTIKASNIKIRGGEIAVGIRRHQFDRTDLRRTTGGRAYARHGIGIGCRAQRRLRRCGSGTDKRRQTEGGN